MQRVQPLNVGKSPNVPWTASRIRRSLSYHRPQHATAQAPVAERPVALPPVIRGAGRVDNLVWLDGGRSRLLRRGSRCSGAQQTPGRVERMTRGARASRTVWAGGLFACHRQPRKGLSHANLHFQIGDEERFAGLRWRPRGQQTSTATWSVDRHRRRRPGKGSSAIRFWSYCRSRTTVMRAWDESEHLPLIRELS